MTRQTSGRSVGKTGGREKKTTNTTEIPLADDACKRDGVSVVRLDELGTTPVDQRRLDVLRRENSARAERRRSGRR